MVFEYIIILVLNWFFYGEYISIKSYEPCQARKEAAISSVFMWDVFSIEELIIKPIF